MRRTNVKCLIPSPLNVQLTLSGGKVKLARRTKLKIDAKHYIASLSFDIFNPVFSFILQFLASQKW